MSDRERKQLNQCLGCITLLVVLVSPQLALVSKAASETRPVSQISKDLRAAVVGQDISRAVELVNELAAVGSVQAYQAIVKYAFTGVSYALEKQAGKNLLIGASNPKVRALVLKEALKNRDYKTRIVLLGVVAGLIRHGDSGALDTLHEALEDRVKSVKLTALRWITKLAKHDSLEPLVDAFEKSQKKGQDRVYFDIRRALKTISGHEFATAADWRNFLAGAGKKPRKPKKGRGRTELYKRPSFFSVTVESDRMMFVIDTSHSMLIRDPELEDEEKQSRSKPTGKTEVKKGAPGKKTAPKPPPGPPPPERERLLRVKKELIKVIDGLPARTQFGIIAFNHQLQHWGGGAMLKTATSAHKSDAIRWVRSLRATGATRTDLAIREALKISNLDTIYLLTDGAPKDERNQRLPIQPILDLCRNLNRFLKARVHTISFSQIRDKRMRTFVKDLAKQNDGTCTLLK